MHAFDGRTDRILIARPRLHSMQRGKVDSDCRRRCGSGKNGRVVWMENDGPEITLVCKCVLLPTIFLHWLIGCFMMKQLHHKHNTAGMYRPMVTNLYFSLTQCTLFLHLCLIFFWTTEAQCFWSSCSILLKSACSKRTSRSSRTCNSWPESYWRRM